MESLTSKEINDLQETFNTAGWKFFVDQLKQERLSLVAALEDATANDTTLRYCQGRVSKIREIVGLENAIEMFVEQQKAELENDDDADL